MEYLCFKFIPLWQERKRGREGERARDFSTPRYDLTGWFPWCKSREKHYSGQSATTLKIRKPEALEWVGVELLLIQICWPIQHSKVYPVSQPLLLNVLIKLFTLFIWRTSSVCGPSGSSGKALGYRLDGPGSIPGVGGMEIFLHSFVSRLALVSTQHPIKWVPGNFPGGKCGRP